MWGGGGGGVVEANKILVSDSATLPALSDKP